MTTNQNTQLKDDTIQIGNMDEENLEMFETIDKEEDGEVYIREVIDYLKAVNIEFDRNPEVNRLVTKHRQNADNCINYEEYSVLMEELREAGWTRFRPTHKSGVSELDLKGVFRLVDMDNSGAVSRRELKMACKFLGKRYGLDNEKTWLNIMKETDENYDGKLTYPEFKIAVAAAIAIVEAEEEE